MPASSTLLAIQQLREEFQEHKGEDREEFAAMRHELTTKTNQTHDQLDILIQAFGLSKRDDKKPPVGLMSSREWFWKVAGAMGGLLVVEKVVVALAPMTWAFLVSAAKIIAGIH